MKNPTEPDSNHHLGIVNSDFLAATTIGLITYGIRPERSENRGRAVEAVADNSADMVLNPQEDGSRILAGQIQVLNAIFSRYAVISMAALESGKPGWEGALHLALRAQNECRRSIATLNELRNPKKTTFIKSNIERQQNNLVVDGGNSAQMDTGIEAAAIGLDQELATVEIQHGGG